MPKKLTQAEFLAKAVAVHGVGRYDYSQLVYTNTVTALKIICHIHGVFEQRPHHHLGKRGCPSCGYLSANSTRRATCERKAQAGIKVAERAIKRQAVDNMATCSKCGIRQPLESFSKSSASKIGVKSHCKSCVKKKRDASNTPENIERRRLRVNKERAKAYNLANKERIYLQRKTYRDSLSPEQKTLLREKLRKWWKTNTSINKRLADNCRARIRHALRNNIKSQGTRILMGCTAEQLKAHIQSLFLPGMSWANYGRKHEFGQGWEIDHIVPCRAFDLSNPEQQLKCFHYTNLQPLWAVDNQRKNATI